MAGNVNNTTKEPLSRIYDFDEELKKLLKEDKYIARSKYQELLDKYKADYEGYKFCEEYNFASPLVGVEKINFFCNKYKSLIKNSDNSPVKKHNENYIKTHLEKEKEYLDTILQQCGDDILLDEEQRRVVLSDEDYTLVVAGAGTGKTTTVAAKVKYLVEKQHIKPEDILVISFTNKAVEELQERINVKLGINCIISTFHKLGNSILNIKNSINKTPVSEGYIKAVISEYLVTTVLSDTRMLEKLVLFFASYFSAPYSNEDDLISFFQNIANSDFSTFRSKFTSNKDKKDKLISYNTEVLRSQQEVDIANFLYMNQIEYEYERRYPSKIGGKLYTPDFYIKQGDKEAYIEHFGISESGKNNRYLEEDLAKYIKCKEDKISLHKECGTDLIYTYSSYIDESKDYIKDLKEQLIAKGFVLRPRSNKEVYQAIKKSYEKTYITKLTTLITDFIERFKTNGYDESMYDVFKLRSKNVRTKLFLDICERCHYEYKKKLIEGDMVDFQDMINRATLLIETNQLSKEALSYKYIIIDEYQDISRQRYKLVKLLSQFCSSKVMAVGDDWQSVYAFSGSNISLFTNFEAEFGYYKDLVINNTYRNAQELIDIAGTFIQENSSQIKKRLLSSKSISNPVVICTYIDEKNNDKKSDVLGEAVEKAIERIIEYEKTEKANEILSILLIGRYGFDAVNLGKSNYFDYDEEKKVINSIKYQDKVRLEFLTAHSSKGLSADNVIIINAMDAIYGFPTKVETDPIMQLVIEQDNSYQDAEERRLFYVALTRTKNRVLIVTPNTHPSKFICELLDDKKKYPNIELHGDIVHNIDISNYNIRQCPYCGYPLQRRFHKSYGLDLWICSNDQELCGFMTNNLEGGDLCIEECSECTDGYLIVKHGPQGYFLGCTNYDAHGCNTTKSRPIIKSEENIINSNSKLEELEIETNNEEENIDIPMTSYDKIISNDVELREKLRILRKRLGIKFKMLNYMIFSDAVLELLVQHKPTTPDNLLKIKGIGEGKLKQYGKEILEVINEHLNNKGENNTNL